jgi:hypothetical protein
MYIEQHPRLALSALAILVALLAGCSRDGDSPLIAPRALDAPAGVALGERSLPDFAEVLETAEQGSYCSASGQIGGGGSLLLTAPGYSDTCRLEVPVGYYQDTDPLSLKVPVGGVPVFELLPHGTTFTNAVTVTLDYSPWLDGTTFAVGDTLEIFYMDEVEEEFVALSPQAILVADSLDTTIAFQTLHFSRWYIGRGRS